jgi:hypothetical protein
MAKNKKHLGSNYNPPGGQNVALGPNFSQSNVALPKNTVSVPNGATFDVDFTSINSLDSRFTFSRTSNATFINSSGQVQYADSNMFTGSELLQPGLYGWNAQNGATQVFDTTAAAPNGNLGVSQLIASSASGSSAINSSPVSVIGGLTYTLTFYVRAGNSSLLLVGLYEASAFAPATGTILSGPGSISGTGAISITGLTSAWTKVRIYITPTITAAGKLVSFYPDNAQANGLFVYVWGAQFNIGQIANPRYFKTVSTAYSAPRFDYNPTTLAPRGLLIEGSATNLLNWSESFQTTGGAVNWNFSAVNTTRGTVTTTNPTGSSGTVVKVEETTATGIHATLSVPTASASTTYTFSVWAKAAERTFVQLYENGGSSATSMVNLSNGNIVSESVAGNTRVTAMGTTGWYRIEMRFTTAAGQTSANCQMRLSTDGTTTSYAGTTGSGIYVWGAQLEAGSGASSYIQTGISSVQRATDVMYMDGTNFSAWWPSGQSEYSVYFAGDITRTPATTQFMWLARTGSGGTGTSLARHFVTTANLIRANNTANDLNGSLAATVGTRFRSAFAVKSGDSALYVNNGSTTASVTASDTVLNTGATQIVFNPNSDVFQHIASLTFWPMRLSNATLQSFIT